IVVVGAEMELSDRDDAMAGGAQAMMPALHRSVIRVGVVPEPYAVNVASGGEGRARRNADRRRRPAGGEAGAARRKGVEVRRPRHGMSVAAHNAASVLIGHDDQQVLTAHASCSRLPAHRTAPSRPRTGLTDTL